MQARLRRRKLCAAFVSLSLLVAALPAIARSLKGRLVTFSVETWDEGAAPAFETEGRSVIVGDNVEFGMEPDGSRNGLQLVPVTVEIMPQRIEITYPDDPLFPEQRFVEAVFNGYVLRFAAECAQIGRAHV